MERRLTLGYECPPAIPPRLAAVRWGSASSLPGLHKIQHRASWSGPGAGSDFAEPSSVPHTPGKRSDDAGQHRCSTASAGVERPSRRFSLEESDFLPRMGSVSSTFSIAGDLLREHRHMLNFDMAQLEAEVLPLVHSPVEKFSIDANFTANVHLTSQEEEMVRHVQEMRTSLSRLHIQVEGRIKELKGLKAVHKSLCLEQGSVNHGLLARRGELQKQRLKLRDSHEEAMVYHRSLQLMLKRMGDSKRDATTAHSVMREEMNKTLFAIKEATARLSEANSAKDSCQEQLEGVIESTRLKRRDHKAELEFLRGCVAQITKRKEADKNQLMKEKTIILDVGKQTWEKLKMSAKETGSELASRMFYSSLQKRDALEAKMQVYVRRIKERTGFSDPKEIVMRMLERHKNQMRIEVQHMKTQARMDDLVRERDVLLRQKQALELSGQAGNTYRRSVIDEIDGRLMAASRRLRLAIHHHLQAANLLASLRSGIDSLAHNLGIHTGARDSSRRSRGSISYGSEPLSTSTSTSASTYNAPPPNSLPGTPPLPHSGARDSSTIRPRGSISHPSDGPSTSQSSAMSPAPPFPPSGGRPPPTPAFRMGAMEDGPPDEALMRLNFIHERLLRLIEAATTPWSEPQPVFVPSRRTSVVPGLEELPVPRQLTSQELRLDRTRFNVRVDLQDETGEEDTENRNHFDDEMFAVDSSRREYMRRPPHAKAAGMFRRGRGDDEDEAFERSTWSVLQSSVDAVRKDISRRKNKTGNLPVLREHELNGARRQSSARPSRPRSGTQTTQPSPHLNRPISPPTAIRSAPNLGALH